MKIAFDIHGTIDSFQDVFKPIMKAYVDSGIKVYVFSGPPIEQIITELEEMEFIKGVHFHDCFSVVDFIKNELFVEMKQHENGNWYCDEETWWDTKGIMCEVFEIDMIFDNDIRYKENMPDETTFILWNSEKN